MAGSGGTAHAGPFKPIAESYREGMGTTGNILGGLSAYAEANKSAKFADARRKNALQEGRNNAYLERLQAARKASSTMAAYGGRGVDVNEGTPVNVLASIEADGEVSALQALYTGDMNALDWNVQKKAAKQRARTAMSGVTANLLDPMNTFGGRDALWGNYLNSGGGTFMGQR
ncbi:hypothetical protein KL86DPRO_11500 [uncultured delta proteobacterium]|uniref:Uncharacterized protein n=1 Tax=uncultured delta proteobacterium TaxID=34034 RepID=A0A212JHW8_9DELT|nr:hypothetical protein KL86DPRO_11500 [uncultured delta proteobacterium]